MATESFFALFLLPIVPVGGAIWSAGAELPLWLRQLAAAGYVSLLALHCRGCNGIPGCTALGTRHPHQRKPQRGVT
mgnify:CR=1 FL=1